MFDRLLKTRGDAQEATRALFAPLLPYFSPGRARVRLGGGAAHFDQTAAELEGFARPLWGLAPLAAGGGKFEHWDLYREGLANGTDPEHPEFWGNLTDRDQRMVELAAIGFALATVPEILWEPLDARAKANVSRYLGQVNEHAYPNNNWKFFRVLVDLGLAHVGVAFDPARVEEHLEAIDSYYVDDGWYRDGPVRRADHYVPFAIHLYGLIYATLAAGDDERRARYRERAALFAKDFRHWFDDEGGVVAFGRSMTYRFATGSFWGGLAYADLEALPWGEIKSLWFNHLRWWAKQRPADRDGVLSIGYAYPNLLMSEQYNSPGSPYWAMKAFLPLALPETHPFWQAEETPPKRPTTPVVLQHPGLVLMVRSGDTIALSAGQENRQMRHGAEKYAKFAYSSRHGFSIESDHRSFERAALDSVLGLSDDGMHFRVREANEEALVCADMLYARWHPWADVEVETWLIPKPPWHVRIHRIRTPRPLKTAEGGFALARADGNPEPRLEEAGLAAITAPEFSGIRDLRGGETRAGRAQLAPPNTSLLWPRSWVPQLRGRIEAGDNLLIGAVLADKDSEAGRRIWTQLPELEPLERIETRFAAEGRRVSAITVPAGSTT